jgi:hypothetical protein
MKVIKAIKIILLSIFSGFLVILGGYGYMVHKQNVEHEQLVKLLSSKAAKNLYEKRIAEEDPNWGKQNGVIHSYRLDEDSVEYNPMGGANLDLIINNDEKLYLGFIVSEDEDGHLQPEGYSTSSELDDLLSGKER